MTSAITGCLHRSPADTSIRATMEDGGITEVVYVDYESTSMLSLYVTFAVVVYGR